MLEGFATMFRIVIEALLQGLPEEQMCIAKLREGMEMGGICTGSQTSFACASNNVLVKVLPAEASHQLSHAFIGVPMKFAIQIHVEGEKAEDVVKIADIVYKTLKGCNILLRIV
ncbi:MAG: hypothetical protein QW320_00100 [Ignisphaera sp.]